MGKDAKGRKIIVRYYSEGKEHSRDEELEMEKVMKIRFVLSEQPADYIDVALDWQGDALAVVTSDRPISIHPLATNRLLVTTSWERVAKESKKKGESET